MGIEGNSIVGGSIGSRDLARTGHKTMLNSREERNVKLKPCVFETTRVFYLS